MRILRQLLASIFPIPPRRAGIELCKTNVLLVHVDGANVSAVAVGLVAIGLRILPAVFESFVLLLLLLLLGAIAWGFILHKRRAGSVVSAWISLQGRLLIIRVILAPAS
jgi:hypothetical protein